MQRQTVSNGEVELSYEVTGEGPTLLLLHGWPDTGALWNDVVPDLVEAGYRVVVPDLRGCGRSAKPAETASYQMHHLVGDVQCIVDAVGAERVTLVGHDWGAALAWTVAAYLPERVEALVVISVGHANAFYGAGLAQQMKSWYIMLFIQEGLAEAFLRKNDYEFIRIGHPRSDAVIAELERDGQLSSHLRWYRANIAMDAFVTERPEMASVASPTLGIWSSGDFGLTERQMKESAAYCTGGFTFVRLEGFGHWVPLEAPRELAREILDFLRPIHAPA
jgi:pimeloyl-ACP methyl ester carboxylesterase